MNGTQELPRSTDWNNFWSAEAKKAAGRTSWSKRRILKVLSPYLRPEAHVLDAGCGSGFFSAAFHERGLRVTALDYSEEALRMAEQATGGAADLIQADLLNDDLAARSNKTFDLIFSDGLFEHFIPADQDKIMCALKSVLSVNGVIATFVPNRWSPWELIRPWMMPGISEVPFIRAALKDLNKRNGLVLIAQGGINALPCALSPEGYIAGFCGMLLYSLAKHDN